MLRQFLSYKYILLFLGVSFVLLGAGYGVYLSQDVNRRGLLLDQNKYVQHFLHSYHSLRKIPDVLFVHTFFIPNTLPEYKLVITPNNIARLNDNLPKDNALRGKLEQDSRVYVSGYFGSFFDGYVEKIKVRYRGLNANHWNSLKKSFRVKFPDGDFWEGRRVVNFVIPYDRAYFSEPLAMYRAKKLGLISIDMFFSRLDFNGNDGGVFLTFEHWSKEFLAKKGLPESALYLGRDEFVEYINDEKQYKNVLADVDVFSEPDEEISTFFRFIHYADDETFQKLAPVLFNLESVYNWNILKILSQSNHTNEHGNAVIYFNGVTGRFEMIPWDMYLFPPASPYKDNVSTLTRRLMSFDTFKEERNMRLLAYLDDEKNLEDDLAFYDNLYDHVKIDFLKDHNKLYNNFQFLSFVKKHRTYVEDNFTAARDVLSYDKEYYTYNVEEGTVFEPAGSFSYLEDVSSSVDQFLVQHPRFFFVDKNTLGISGNHVISQTVVLPLGFTLKVFPGTTLRLDDGVSLVSYGGFDMEGTLFQPIKVLRLREDKPWGSLVSINASKRSIVTHATFDGGSGDRVNGVIVTGMLAFHNSDVSIDTVQFLRAKDDDALNIKMSSGEVINSFFENNSSDGFDLDYAEGDFIIKGNKFVNGGGDAIDLSFSTVRIEENTIDGCVDKGISVGEHSTPSIDGNTIVDCDIAIAVKDLSTAIITNNVISSNHTGVSTYRKKPEFGGGVARLGDNSFDGNDVYTEHDDYSEVTCISNRSCILQ